jgi:hypothetical protein
VAKLNGTVEEIRKRIRENVPEEIRDKLQTLLRIMDKMSQDLKFAQNVVYTVSDDAQKLILEIDIEQLAHEGKDTE